MEFYKDLSLLGWEEVKARQQHRLPLVDEWISKVEMKKGDFVLDIGPGPGVFTLKYAEAIGETSIVIALEKSLVASEYFKEQLSTSNQNIKIMLGNAEDYDYSSLGHLDIIMLTDILHHADSPYRILENLFRSQNIKGTNILISEFDPEAAGEFGPPIHKRIGQRELAEMLNKVGFTVSSSSKQPYEHYYIVAKK